MAVTDNATLLCWTDGALAPAAVDEGRPGALLAADSWLVVDGAARAVDAHWARFGAACAEHGVSIAGFRRAVADALPVGGRWFPRVELGAGGGLRLRVRPAPAACGSLRVTVAAPGDPRSQPRRKGPDLELLIGLRAASGADELLLCDDEGRLLEGALSSLLWWEGDVLWTTPGEGTLPGVTRALILTIAGARGVKLGERSPLPAQLAGCEVWLTSALHGIRAVGEWVAPEQAAGRGVRAPRWQAALEAAR